MLNGSLVATVERPLTGGTGTVKYQHTDALGSPVAITDAWRTVIETSEYEPFGRVGNRAARDGAGYTGHAEDAATGLTYMQQRYYDPQIGRFLSVDPVTASSVTGSNFNRYWYASNNPYRFTDPDGRFAVDDEPPSPLHQPEPATLPPVTATATAPITLQTVVVTAQRPISLPSIPWPALGEGMLGRIVPPLLLFWPSPMGAAACEMPGGPPCGGMMSSSFPEGFWPADAGSAEWGRRHGKGPKDGKDKFHRGVKGNTHGARPDHDFGVNPDTGEVIDQNGESVGNLNDEN